MDTKWKYGFWMEFLSYFIMRVELPNWCGSLRSYKYADTLTPSAVLLCPQAWLQMWAIQLAVRGHELLSQSVRVWIFHVLRANAAQLPGVQPRHHQHREPRGTRSNTVESWGPCQQWDVYQPQELWLPHWDEHGKEDCLSEIHSYLPSLQRIFKVKSPASSSRRHSR